MHLRSLSVGDAGDAEVPVRQPLLPDFGKLQSAPYLETGWQVSRWGCLHLQGW